jgi:Uri superfamily endonuclease
MTSATLNEGIYLLLIRLESDIEIDIGALGRWSLKVGWYVYTGRARRNLRQRVLRHLRRPSVKRWHIDYLTTLHAVHPAGAVLLFGRRWRECRLNTTVGQMLSWSVPVPGFGSSDCQNGCPAHLWYSPVEIALEELARKTRPSCPLS